MDERKLDVGVLNPRNDFVRGVEAALLDRAVSLTQHQLGIFARERFLNGLARGRLRRSNGIGRGFRAKFTVSGKRRRLRQGDEQDGSHVCRSQLASPSSKGW